MHEVVLIAVRNAVSEATITFTASSIIRCFFILGFLFCLGRTRMNTECSVKIEFRENPCHSVAIILTVALVIGLGSEDVAQRGLLLEALLLAADGADLTLYEVAVGEDAVLLQRAAGELLTYVYQNIPSIISGPHVVVGKA